MLHNLYKIMGYKYKNSVLKSVNITDNYDDGHARIVEVEPYDLTGNHYIDGCPAKYDQGLFYIEKTLTRLEVRMLKNNHHHTRNLYRIQVYSNRYRPLEYYFDPYNHIKGFHKKVKWDPFKQDWVLNEKTWLI